MWFGRNIANRLRLRFVEPSLCVIRFRHADIDICLQGHNAKKAELAGVGRSAKIASGDITPMMEMISRNEIVAGNLIEVPKSRSIVFTLGRRGHHIYTPRIDSMQLCFRVRIKQRDISMI